MGGKTRKSPFFSANLPWHMGSVLCTKFVLERANVLTNVLILTNYLFYCSCLRPTTNMQSVCCTHNFNPACTNSILLAFGFPRIILSRRLRTVLYKNVSSLGVGESTTPCIFRRWVWKVDENSLNYFDVLRGDCSVHLLSYSNQGVINWLRYRVIFFWNAAVEKASFWKFPQEIPYITNETQTLSRVELWLLGNLRVVNWKWE